MHSYTEDIVADITERCAAGTSMKQAIYIALSNYDIKPKATELATMDDSWQLSVKTFINRKRTSGLSEQSLKMYLYHLCKFFVYYHVPVQNITEGDIYDYLMMYKKTRNASNGYLEIIRRCLSAFFGWEYKKGYITHNPIDGIDPIKQERRIKKEFSYEELERLKNVCTNKRDRALIEFLYSTGVRVGEVVNLTKDDLDIQNRTAIVFGKGKKEREVYLTETAVMYLNDYFNSRHDNSDYVFVTLKGEHKHLKVTGVQNIFRKLGRAAAVHKSHPHRMRRTTATHLLNSGMELQEVQMILGHAKPETTLGYTVLKHENIQFHHRKYMS